MSTRQIAKTNAHLDALALALRALTLRIDALDSRISDLEATSTHSTIPHTEILDRPLTLTPAQIMMLRTLTPAQITALRHSQPQPTRAQRR